MKDIIETFAEIIYEVIDTVFEFDDWRSDT